MDINLEIEKLSPQEGDIVVIKSKDILNSSQIEMIQKTLTDILLKYEYHIEGIILMGNITIEKLSQEELKKLKKGKQ